MGYGPAPGPTIKKALCHTCPLGGARNKYRGSCINTALLQLLSRISVGRAGCWHGSGRVCLGSWIISFGLRGPSSQAFTPFRGGLGSLPGAWGAPNKGNAEGAFGIFGKLRARVGYRPAPGPTQKKALCHTCPLGGAVNKYRCSCINTALLQLLSRISACRAGSWHGSGQVCLNSWIISFGLRGPSPLSFTSFRRVGFIARRLRRP